MTEPFPLPWYSPEGYARLREASTDGERMPPSYEMWVPSALQIEGELKRLGRSTQRVTVEAETFLEWCQARSMAPDGAARHAYAKAMVESGGPVE